MTTQGSGATPKSDFGAAEEIRGILHGRERAEQERILRWVSESLGVAPGPSTSPAPAPSQSSPATAAAQAPTSTGGPPATDIRSFVQEKQPKSDIQFVAVVAYFYRFVAPSPDRKEVITSGDLQAACRLAQRPVFKTSSVPLNNSVKQGYMDRGGRGEYRLNAVGENLVAMTLPGGNDANGGSTAKRRRGTPKKQSRKVKKASGKRTPKK
jgi:hypothetical protein